MLAYGHNGTISINATFGTNDVKYHLFTWMRFDVHHTKVPLAWIITSQQTMDHLIKWFKPLKAKKFSIMAD